MSEPRQGPLPEDRLPQGVRGDFDPASLRDYAPMQESEDPIMQVRVDAFEGPLDLLLHIIRREGMNLLDVPMAQICNAYVQMLNQMRDLNIDIAAEFLVMAATLTHIKSRLLLPKEEQGPGEAEEEADPRADLIRRLLEYRRFKLAAEEIGARVRLGREVFGRPTPSGPPDDAPPRLVEMNALELVDALRVILQRSSKQLVHEVFAERMSVGARINELIDVFLEREHVTFDELLSIGEEPVFRTKRVITFLALLEMTRLHLTRIHQPRDGGTIYITPIRENLAVDAADLLGGVDVTASTGTNGPSGDQHDS